MKFFWSLFDVALSEKYQILGNECETKTSWHDSMIVNKGGKRIYRNKGDMIVVFGLCCQTFWL